MEGLACVFEALAGFVFGKEALVYGALACVVDQVGNARKAGVDAGELQVVVDLVEEIAERGGVAIARADEARELRRELLLKGFLEHGAAQAGAGGEEAVEVAAGGFVEIAVGFFRTGSGDNARAQRGGALHSGLNKLENLKDKSCAEEIVLLRIKSGLNGLPCGGSGRRRGRLQACERGEPLAGMQKKTLAHFSGEPAPVGNEGGRIFATAQAELVVNDIGQNAAQLLKAAGVR